MVIDVCTINDEADLWEIHYNHLFEHVDEFIVVEFDETFSGKSKQLMGTRTDIWYDPICQWPKVRYFSFSAKDWEKYRELAESSPNTQHGKGAKNWVVEFMQKESIKDTLTHLQDDDIVFIGDVDEVWEPDIALLGAVDLPIKLRLRVYTYWLNNRSSELFFGPIVSKYFSIKNKCLNHIRSTENTKSIPYYGWHFTSMGGTESVKKKLTDSYTQESYATSAVLDNLEYNMAENKDFLGRNFTYTTDESDWPTYLTENRDKYKHIIK